MSLTVILIIAVGVIVAATVAFRSWVKSRAWHGASGIARKIFPVWAAQGPFETGAESARAMHYAWLAVSEDLKKVEGMAEDFSQHSIAFDADPEEWEETRQTALKAPVAGSAVHFLIVIRLRAADTWTREIADLGQSRCDR